LDGYGATAQAARPEGEFWMGMTLAVLTFIHLLGLGLWVGGIVALLVLITLAARAAEQGRNEAVRSLSHAAFVLNWVIMVGGALTAVSGVIQTFGASTPLLDRTAMPLFLMQLLGFVAFIGSGFLYRATAVAAQKGDELARGKTNYLAFLAANGRTGWVGFFVLICLLGALVTASLT
jgi:putative copper export protein